MKRLAGFLHKMRPRGIQTTITFAVLFVTVIMMLFVGTSQYNHYLQISEDSSKKNARQLVASVNRNLDFYLNSMRRNSDFLKNKILWSNRNEEIQAALQSVTEQDADVLSAAFFDASGRLIASSWQVPLKKDAYVSGADWFNQPLRYPTIVYYSPPHVQNLYEARHDWVVTISRIVRYEHEGKKLRGVLQVDVKFGSIDSICSSAQLGNSGYVYLVDFQNNIVYHPQQQLLYAGLKEESLDNVEKNITGGFTEKFEGRDRYVYVETVNNARWKLVGVTYLDEMVYTRASLIRNLILTIFAGALIAVAVANVVALRISSPLRQLEKHMRRVQQGHFDIEVKEMAGNDEVAELSRSFKIMLTRIQELMDEMVRIQEAKRKYELDAMQAQINPHFLYNTLDSIVHLMEVGDLSGAITMVTSLARLFRISISRGKNIISVRQEIEHARYYLTIQKIRYKQRFDFQIEAQEEALECTTLKLILQPILENALYHGIEYLVDPGKIFIKVEVDGDTLRFTIQDNGVGMSESILSQIFSVQASSRGSGIGVKNVHQRIQIYYGEEFGLHVTSELEEGTVVVIELPARSDDDEKNAPPPSTNAAPSLREQRNEKNQAEDES